MSRWIEKEHVALQKMKEMIKSDLESYPKYPEVVGDRRLIRFLRGNGDDAIKAAKSYQNFLKWRKKYDVNNIRNDILYNGKNNPTKFPFANKVLDVLPHILIAFDHCDNEGRPISLETFDWDPINFLDKVTIEEFTTFYIYGLEYRIMVVEQLAEERELQYLKNYPDPSDRIDGYGNVLQMCFIRDMKGIGMRHMTAKSTSIINVTLEAALPNYPEYLGKCHMLNVPWIFTILWNAVKGSFDENLIRKFAMYGRDFLAPLSRDVPIESIPEYLGGKLSYENASFQFDIKPGGLYEPVTSDQSTENIGDSYQESPREVDKNLHPIDLTVQRNKNSNGRTSSFNPVTNDDSVLFQPRATIPSIKSRDFKNEVKNNEPVKKSNLSTPPVDRIYNSKVVPKNSVKKSNRSNKIFSGRSNFKYVQIILFSDIFLTTVSLTVFLLLFYRYNLSAIVLLFILIIYSLFVVYLA